MLGKKERAAIGIKKALPPVSRCLSCGAFFPANQQRCPSCSVEINGPMMKRIERAKIRAARRRDSSGIKKKPKNLKSPTKVFECDVIDVRDSVADFEIKVVGESHYKTAINQACTKVPLDGVSNLLVDAVLVPDNQNIYDKNAVKVMLKDRHVGYLSRDDAKQLRLFLVKRKAGRVLCSASVTGGWWMKDRNKQADFGIELAIPEHWFEYSD